MVLWHHSIYIYGGQLAGSSCECPCEGWTDWLIGAGLFGGTAWLMFATAPAGQITAAPRRSHAGAQIILLWTVAVLQ